MNVKVLLFPLSVTVSVALGIWYIKPEIDTIMRSRSVLDEKLALADMVDQKVENAHRLASDLETHQTDVAALEHYYPFERDDDRVVDAVNFLSEQSGLALVSVKIDKSADVSAISVTEDEASSASADVLFGDGNTNESTAPERRTPVINARPKSLDVSVSAVGSYENVRDTVAKLSHMDRFGDIVAVEVTKEAATSSGGALASIDTNLLSLSLKLKVSLLPKVTTKDNVFLPLLDHDRFAFDFSDTLRAHISSPIPTMTPGLAGVSNPFIR
jgi:hypothetical protein